MWGLYNQYLYINKYFSLTTRRSARTLTIGRRLTPMKRFRHLDNLNLVVCSYGTKPRHIFHSLYICLLKVSYFNCWRKRYYTIKILRKLVLLGEHRYSCVSVRGISSLRYLSIRECLVCFFLFHLQTRLLQLTFICRGTVSKIMFAVLLNRNQCR